MRSETRAEALFWQIWQRHRKYLYQQSLRLMRRNQADAEDALSTAMLRALEHFSLRTVELVHERAWLSRILRNVCVDLHRRWRYDKPSEAESSEDTLSGLVSMKVAAPDEVLLDRERAAAFQEHLQALSPALRTPFMMRYHQGMAYADIATHLRLTHCNARKRIQLACGILRAALNKETRGAG